MTYFYDRSINVLPIVFLLIHYMVLNIRKGYQKNKNKGHGPNRKRI